VEHTFPHPLDESAPLRIVARDSLLVPRDRDQPLLTVHYTARPSMLMPKVSWSGSSTLCPGDATVLEVRHSRESAPWRTPDVAAWQKYWGTHATGLIGGRLEFAGSPPFDISEIRSPRQSDQLSIGANLSELCYPLPIVLDQLPLLLERLEVR
jgi:hypothetical protein